MKDLNYLVFLVGLFISFMTGIITLLIFHDLSFSGMCIIASAILYSHSLEQK
ncbi:MAG: hypothetical protein K6F23_05475 [Solobacterium sp.]|nr:hypothetical protein [Solobacterium sp.]